MCSVRSGSTLLRVLLDSHSRIHSPAGAAPARHDRRRSRPTTRPRRSARSGSTSSSCGSCSGTGCCTASSPPRARSILVNKTPNDVFIADLIATLLARRALHLPAAPPGRDRPLAPGDAPQDTPERNARMVLRYGNAIEEARADAPGRDRALRGADRRPARGDAADLRVPRRAVGAGDARVRPLRPRPHEARAWATGRQKIKSGEVQPADAAAAAEEIHPSLHELCVAWGYEPARRPRCSRRLSR